jgi:hypothetical protein
MVADLVVDGLQDRGAQGHPEGVAFAGGTFQKSYSSNDIGRKGYRLQSTLRVLPLRNL